jgi:hypothetical protein
MLNLGFQNIAIRSARGLERCFVDRRAASAPFSTSLRTRRRVNMPVKPLMTQSRLIGNAHAIRGEEYRSRADRRRGVHGHAASSRQASDAAGTPLCERLKPRAVDGQIK